jgi:hypothetical protein
MVEVKVVLVPIAYLDQSLHLAVVAEVLTKLVMLVLLVDLAVVEPLTQVVQLERQDKEMMVDLEIVETH